MFWDFGYLSIIVFMLILIGYWKLIWLRLMNVFIGDLEMLKY